MVAPTSKLRFKGPAMEANAFREPIPELVAENEEKESPAEQVAESIEPSDQARYKFLFYREPAFSAANSSQHKMER